MATPTQYPTPSIFSAIAAATQHQGARRLGEELADTTRILMETQDELARSEGQVVKNLIFLNTALGGGWSVDQGVPGVKENTDSETEPETSGQGK